MIRTVVGYTGGKTKKVQTRTAGENDRAIGNGKPGASVAFKPVRLPNYRSVCSGDGNVECVAIFFDTKHISYAKIIECFIAMHNVFKRKKRQYCSAVFVNSKAQYQTARKMLSPSAATTVERLRTWTDAEKRHQKYLERKEQRRREREVLAAKLLPADNELRR